MTTMARCCMQSLLKIVNSVIGMVGIAMILYALWMLRVWHKQMGPYPPPFFGPDAPAPWFIYATLGLGITFSVVSCSGHIAAETANGCCLYIVGVRFAYMFLPSQTTLVGLYGYVVVTFAAIVLMLINLIHYEYHKNPPKPLSILLTGEAILKYFKHLYGHGVVGGVVAVHKGKDSFVIDHMRKVRINCLCFVDAILFHPKAAVTVDVFVNRNWEEDFPEDTTGSFDELKHFVKENFDICKWIGLSVVTVQGLTILLAMILKALGPHQERYYYESDDEYIPDRVPLLKNYVPSHSYVVGDPMYGPKNDAWNIRINSKASR